MSLGHGVELIQHLKTAQRVYIAVMCVVFFAIVWLSVTNSGPLRNFFL